MNDPFLAVNIPSETMRRTFIRGVDGEERERTHPFEVHAHCEIECERQASGFLISLQVEADATASTGNKATKIFICDKAVGNYLSHPRHRELFAETF